VLISTTIKPQIDFTATAYTRQCSEILSPSFCKCDSNISGNKWIFSRPKYKLPWSPDIQVQPAQE
jgi:hypothetical protein